MRYNQTSAYLRSLGPGITLLLGGCTGGRAPSFMIAGSYFPAWLIGLGISIILTVILRACLIRVRIDDALPVRLLVYSCLCLLLTLAFTYVFSPQ